MSKFKTVFILLLSTIFFTHYGFAHTSSSSHTDFLAISDIHFDPFYACNEQSGHCLVADLLIKEPISEWNKILTRIDHSATEYGKDTGNFLFKASLDKFKSLIKTQKIKFVIVNGDLVVHDLKTTYFKYYPNSNDTNYEKFAEKLFAYITQEIKKSIANIDAYMVVGNNDTFGEHYTSSPTFYKKMAPLWSRLIHDQVQRVKMENEFRTKGYYSVDANNRLKLIFLNSTFFSPKYLAKSNIEAHYQLAWLRETLQSAVTNQQKVIISFHIPAGVDMYDTVKKNKISLLWREEYLIEFYSIMREFNHSIIALFTSHLHSDWFQSLELGREKLFMSSIPALSPQFGNNPAFKIYRLRNHSLELTDYKVYYLQLPINSKSKPSK